MSVQRQLASATLISGCNCPADGQVLVAGGVIDGNTATTNTAELYDPATGKFTPTGTVNVARGGHVAAVLPGGKVLIVGAFDSPGPLDAEMSRTAETTSAANFASRSNSKNLCGCL
jgi:Kelch motif protein